MSYNLLIDGKVYGPVDKKIEIPLENGDYQDFIVPDLDTITVEPSEVEQTIEASNMNLDGFSEVINKGVSSTYVGSGIPRNEGQTIIPDKSGCVVPRCFLNGDLKIDPIPSNFIIPSGDINLSANGLYDVSAYINAIVNVSNLTRYTSNTVNISGNLYGVQTSYDTSKLKITVGFKPKIFIFRPQSYSNGLTLGKFDSSYNIIAQSFNVFDGITADGSMGRIYTTFITKLTGSSSSLSTSVTLSGGEGTLSVGGTGFYLNPNNNNEVYWYITNSTYMIRTGTWFWEAYG